MLDETKLAADFACKSDPREIAACWDSQIITMSSLVSDLESRQQQLGESIHPDIKPDAVRVQVLAFRRLACQFGLEGSRWVGQFPTGFPIAGVLSRKGTFAENPSTAHPADNRVLFETSEARFRERAAKTGTKNAPTLRREDIRKVEKGWLCPPVELESAGCPAGFRPGCFKIAFRFGVEQAAKLRPCGDLKHILTHSARSAVTPIKLVSWDHLSQICRRIWQKGMDWALFKADHEADYKQIPLSPKDKAYALIAPRSPTDGKWFGFVSRTLTFGAAAAILHYNVFSRMITALVCRKMGSIAYASPTTSPA